MMHGITLHKYLLPSKVLDNENTFIINIYDVVRGRTVQTGAAYTEKMRQY